jgi:hypothetical protein
LIAGGLLALGLLLLVVGMFQAAFRKLFGLAFSLLLVIVLLCVGSLVAAIAVAAHGYRALTHEEVAATVMVQPLGPQAFSARVRTKDGRETAYRLAGDELYVDARVLKWKPIANLLGLHTAYELDRISGRYVDIEDEKTKPRTLHSMASERPVDIFELRRRYHWLEPLVDAEYGSATFIAADRPTTYEVRVSTTGLLVRTAPVDPLP